VGRNPIRFGSQFPWFFSDSLQYKRDLHIVVLLSDELFVKNEKAEAET